MYRKIVVAVVLLPILLVAGCSVFEAVLQPDLPDNIDTAKRLYAGMDLKGAERVLERTLAVCEGSPESQAEVLIIQAKIAWKFHRESQQARELLRQAEDLKVEDKEILALLSRVERESAEFQKALATASRAIKLAESDEDWTEARIHLAQVILEQSLASIEKNQPFDRPLVEQGVAILKEVLLKVPGYPASSRILPGLALLAQNGEAAFLAWKSYFHIVEDDPPSSVLAGPYELLRTVLPQWQDRSPNRQEGLLLIKGLGDSRFYEYGKLVKQLFFKNDPLSNEPELRDILLYNRLKDSGLEAHNLVMAFIDHYDQFYLSNTVFGHEGRHAIEQKFFADDFRRWSHVEREFRAKLSEIIFCSDPYLELV